MAELARPDLKCVIALSGSLAILALFALIDAYAVRSCFSLAHAEIELPQVCNPEHLFRSTLEIGGMAVGLYGMGKLVKT
jgi:hypothetical protein